jgi:multiple sugar transport system substrate-binding protein
LVPAPSPVQADQSGRPAGGVRPVQLDYYVVDGWLTQSYWDNVIFAEFRERHPHVTINPVPWAYAERFTKVTALFAAGTPPDFSHWLHPLFALNGLLLDLDGRLREARVKPTDFFPAAAEYITVGGKMYGYPYRLNTLLMYYNRGLLEAAGVARPPAAWGDRSWTWDIFLDALPRLTRSQGEVVGQWGWDNMKELYQYPWYYGEDWLSRDRTRLALDPHGRGVAHLQRVIDQMTRRRTMPTADERRTERRTENNPFRAGKAAFTLDFTSAMAELDKIPGLAWGVAPTPMGTHVATVGYTDAWVMFRGRHPDEAWTLLKYLGGTDVQKQRAAFDASYPPLKSLSTWAEKEMAAFPADHRKTAWDGLKHGKLPLTHLAIRGADKVEAAINEAFVPVYAGTKSAAQAIEEIAPPVNQLLGGGG